MPKRLRRAGDGGWLSAIAEVVVIHEEKRFAASIPRDWVSACSVDIVKRRRVLKGSTLQGLPCGVGFCLELGAGGFITQWIDAWLRRECPHPAGFERCDRKIVLFGFGRNGFPVLMIVPDRAISGSVSRSWSFVSSAYTGGTDKKSIAAGRRVDCTSPGVCDVRRTNDVCSRME